jgi:hypothetical protein
MSIGKFGTSIEHMTMNAENGRNDIGHRQTKSKRRSPSFCETWWRLCERHMVLFRCGSTRLRNQFPQALPSSQHWNACESAYQLRQPKTKLHASFGMSLVPEGQEGQLGHNRHMRLWQRDSGTAFSHICGRFYKHPMNLKTSRLCWLAHCEASIACTSSTCIQT